MASERLSSPEHSNTRRSVYAPTSNSPCPIMTVPQFLLPRYYLFRLFLYLLGLKAARPLYPYYLMSYYSRIDRMVVRTPSVKLANDLGRCVLGFTYYASKTKPERKREEENPMACLLPRSEHQLFRSKNREIDGTSSPLPRRPSGPLGVATSLGKGFTKELGCLIGL